MLVAIVVVAVILAAGGVAAGVAASSGSGGSGGRLTAWNGAASSALTPLADRIPLMAQQEQQWEQGRIPTSDYRAELAQTAAVVGRAAAAVDRLPPYPGQPGVDQMYAAAAGLYVSAVRMEEAGIDVARPPLDVQVMLISDRIRELADRTFDQGRVLTAAGLVPPGLPPGTKVQLPAEVPEWSAEGLAAGPPLAAAPGPAAPFPPLREGARPTEPVAEWHRTVAALDLPSTESLDAELAGPSADRLGATATALQAASDRLGAAPDPSTGHGREISVRRRLALLIEAEACRAGQAAALAPAGPGPSELRAAATALVGLAGDVRPPGY